MGLQLLISNSFCWLKYCIFYVSPLRLAAEVSLMEESA